jgi:hypothetical protein
MLVNALVLLARLVKITMRRMCYLISVNFDLDFVKPEIDRSCFCLLAELY